jgi:sugar-specific transcriptional regulator TrmB
VGLLAIANINSGVARSEQRKDVARKLLEQVPLYHWFGCRKIRSFFFEGDGEAASVASFDRSMITRLAHLAQTNEHSGESGRDIARQIGCRGVFAAAAASG